MTNTLPTPDQRPEADVVLYDGRCIFCRTQVERLAWWDCQGRLSYLSMHDAIARERFPEVSTERLVEEMCIVDQKGNKHWGADAFRHLTVRLRRLWWAAPLMWFPGMMLLARPVYGWVSRNRYRFMGKVEECENGSCAVHRD